MTKPNIENFVSHTVVSRVFEKKGKRAVDGVGADAVVEEYSQGWWITVGGLEWFVGKEQPLAVKGNEVTISLSVKL